MRLNPAGQTSPDAAGAGLLQQRLAGLSSAVPGGLDGDHAASAKEARDQLRAGNHVRRRVTTRPGDAQADERASKTWHLWVVFDILLLLLIVPIVVAVPTVLDCRKKGEVPGFFVGDSFGKCARAGIEERWTILDSRLKLLVRNSGH